MDKAELAVDRKIDPNELDIVCLDHTDLYWKWAERLVLAEADLEREAHRLEVMEASMQMKARQNPEAYGLTNVTDASVKSAVKAHHKYVGQVDKIQVLQLEVSLLKKAEASLHRKEKMLDHLIDLFGKQYFAGPKVPRNLIDLWNGRNERTERVNERQRSRRRVRREK